MDKKHGGEGMKEDRKKYAKGILSGFIKNCRYEFGLAPEEIFDICAEVLKDDPYFNDHYTIEKKKRGRCILSDCLKCPRYNDCPFER